MAHRSVVESGSARPRGNTEFCLDAAGNTISQSLGGISPYTGPAFIYGTGGFYTSFTGTDAPMQSGAVNPFSALLFDPYVGYKGQYGYQTDHSTGMILCTNRWYDPSTGTWLTRDPIGLDGGINPYAYCEGNPVMGIDPLGLSVKRQGGAVIVLSGLKVDTDGNTDADVQSPFDTSHQDHTSIGGSIDAKTVPYIVIYNVPKKHKHGNYGVHKGDYGVVIYGEQTVGVIVGDTGPNFGDEASIYVHLQLGNDPRTKDGNWLNSIADNVQIIMFPGSSNKHKGPFTNADIQKHALSLYNDWVLSQLWGK